MRTSRAGGILSGLLITFVVLVCAGVGIVFYLTRHIEVQTTDRNGGADISIDTPAGHFQMRARDRDGGGLANVPSDVPLYPDAKDMKDSGGGAVFQWTTKNGQDHGMAVSASEMITHDSVDKVVSWYQGQLPGWMVFHEHDGAIRLELSEGGYKRIVAIHEKSDGTHIGVASVGKPAAN